jgi:predicted NBD/HSP70 family sugar kinase
VYWSPDAIVLGGSMVVGDPRIPLEAIKKHTVAVLNGFVPCPEILDATLKDDGGLYGAMAFLRQKLDNK